MPDECNVYVAPLPPSISEADLNQLFAPYGPIVSIRIASQRRQQNVRYGFVLFNNPQSADTAVKAVSGMVLAGAKLQVRSANRSANPSQRKATSKTDQSSMALNSPTSPGLASTLQSSSTPGALSSQGNGSGTFASSTSPNLTPENQALMATPPLASPMIPSPQHASPMFYMPTSYFYVPQPGAGVPPTMAPAPQQPVPMVFPAANPQPTLPAFPAQPGLLPTTAAPPNQWPQQPSANHFQGFTNNQ